VHGRDLAPSIRQRWTQLLEQISSRMRPRAQLESDVPVDATKTLAASFQCAIKRRIPAVEREAQRASKTTCDAATRARQITNCRAIALAYGEYPGPDYRRVAAERFPPKLR
jgi:hypothetical protein